MAKHYHVRVCETFTRYVTYTVEAKDPHDAQRKVMLQEDIKDTQPDCLPDDITQREVTDVIRI